FVCAQVVLCRLYAPANDSHDSLNTGEGAELRIRIDFEPILAFAPDENVIAALHDREAANRCDFALAVKESVAAARDGEIDGGLFAVGVRVAFDGHLEVVAIRLPGMIGVGLKLGNFALYLLD